MRLTCKPAQERSVLFASKSVCLSMLVTSPLLSITSVRGSEKTNHRYIPPAYRKNKKG